MKNLTIKITMHDNGSIQVLSDGDTLDTFSDRHHLKNLIQALMTYVFKIYNNSDITELEFETIWTRAQNEPEEIGN